jgi:hypothetical protein
MKCLRLVSLSLCLLLSLSLMLFSQTTPPTNPTTPPSAFADTTINFGLTPITLPGAKTSVPGAETDVKLNITTNNAIGETTLLSSNYQFLGGRYDRIIPQFSKWLNNVSPSLNGYNFQLGLTASLGVVHSPSFTMLGQNQEHWGERAGAFINYSFNSSTGLGVEAQWCNLPGYAHTTYSVAIGPNFHF